MTKLLIVGGNGFLGSHLVDRLVAEGHEVAVFDRFSTDRPRYDATDVRAITGDIADRDALARAMRGVDQVFHLVAPTTPASADTDPVADVRDGLPRSVGLLQSAVESSVSRVVFASSGGAIYGDQQADHLSESHLPAPISPYAIGKLAVEGYLRYFRHTFGLDTVSLRIANPYSHRQRGDRGQGFVAVALHAMKQGLPVTVFGDGSMVRDYIHADDVTAVVASMIDAPHQHEVYNLGSGVGVSVAQLLALLERVTGRHAAIVQKPAPASFVQRSVLDISRVTEEFGVNPSIELEGGVRSMWARMSGAQR